MSYMPEKEVLEYIFIIIELFKQSKYEEVIKIIKEKNIDPQHQNEIISDYAAIWLEEPHLIPFFKEIKKLGGDPLGHDSIIKNVAQYGKADTLKYLIKEGALTAPAIKDYLCYAINTAIMGGKAETLKVLSKHLDLTKHYLQGEKNPSFVNRALSNPDKEIFDYLFQSNLIQPYLFTKETIEQLESSFKTIEVRNPKKEEQIKEYNLLNYFIEKVADNFGLKNKYISENGYESGDITTIFKKIEYDVLNKSLKKDNSKATKVKKI